MKINMLLLWNIDSYSTSVNPRESSLWGLRNFIFNINYSEIHTLLIPSSSKILKGFYVQHSNPGLETLRLISKTRPIYITSSLTRDYSQPRPQQGVDIGMINESES